MFIFFLYFFLGFIAGIFFKKHEVWLKIYSWAIERENKLPEQKKELKEKIEELKSCFK